MDPFLITLQGNSIRPSTEQFQSWYPEFAGVLAQISTGPCNESLNAYHESFVAPANSEAAWDLHALCYSHEKCMLDHMTTDWSANLNSATVVLGLLPTFLSTIGPSIAEISLLSAHRPLLSLLISLGAPAIYPTRLFEYINPVQALGDHRDRLTLKRMRPWRAAGLSALQYILAIGAVVNNITTSTNVGTNTILAWGCTTTFAPLIWAAVPSFIHIVAATGYIAARRRAQPGDSDKPRGWLAVLKNRVANEITICANHQKSEYVVQKVPHWAAALSVAAGVMGFLQIIIGVIIFSGLLFAGVCDVLNQIIWRYLLSTAFCRVILLIELAGLRHSQEVQQGK